ncbi:MAG: EAL domain-containing protein [Pseudomonadota bacterium]
MHPILKSQLAKATRPSGVNGVLQVGELLDIVSAFYAALDADQTSIHEALHRHGGQGLIPEPADHGETLTSSSGIRARFQDLHDDDLRSVLDNVADMVVTVSREGEIQFSNRAAVRFFKPSARSLAGKPLAEVLPIPEGVAVATFLAPYLVSLEDTHPKVQTGLLKVRRPEGKAYQVEVTASHLSAMAAGDYVLCLRDVSERVAAERAARENHERYRALVEHAPEAILVYDVKQYRFVDANEKASTFFNLSRQRLLTNGFFGLRDASPDATPDAEQARIDAYLQRALDGQQPTFEWVYRPRDGRELQCEVRLSHLPALGRSLVRASVTSIAERKQREVIEYSEKKLLEMIATDRPLNKVLRAVCRTAERMAPGGRAAIMLADSNETTLGVQCAPAFSKLELNPIRTLSLKAAELSCGVAMATRKVAITTDVRAHHAWKNHIEFADRLDVSSVWSIPLGNNDDHALGTLDLYFSEFCEPNTEQLDALNGLARLAALAVASDRSKQALSISEGRFTSLFNHVLEGVYIATTEGHLLAANPALVEMLGYNDEQDLLQNLSRSSAYVRESDARRFEQLIQKSDRVAKFESKMRRKDGMVIDVLENARLVAEDGREPYLEGTISDVTERKRAERAVFAAKERAEVTLKSIADGVITCDEHGCVEYMNPVAEALTGWKLRAMVGQPIEEVMTLVNEHTRELLDNPIVRCLNEGRAISNNSPTLLIDRAGRDVAVQDSTAPIRDDSGRIVGAVMVFHDVTAEGRLSRKLSYQASHDALTGFINRLEFSNVLERAIARAKNYQGEAYALLYLDLDQFKLVNDTFGHTAGDELLRQLSERIQTCVKTNDTVARLGGDEFAVLLGNVSLEGAVDIAEALRQSVEGFRFEWQEVGHTVQVSIGVVEITAQSASVGAVLSAADVACFTAKDLGRNRVHVYKEGETTAHHQQMHWLTRIDRALQDDRFKLFYQPIVRIGDDGETRYCNQYELLLRMIDEDGELVLPSTFIAAAERYDRMPAVDRWVVEHALEHADQGDPNEPAAYTLSINLSGNSLSDDRFLEFVRDKLQSTPLCRGAVCFEITETAAIANLTRVRHFMGELTSLGCRFSLDDFGSGLCSFGYLKNLSVDYVKVDGAFVRNVAIDPVDRSVVAAIAQVAQTMGIETVAEHVETEQIRQALPSMGVKLVQGFDIAEPKPIEQFSPWVPSESMQA